MCVSFFYLIIQFPIAFNFAALLLGNNTSYSKMGWVILE